MAVKLTLTEVKNYFEDERGFTLLETEYINSETPMRYICTCGRTSSMSYKNAKKGRNCRECGREKLSSTKQVYTSDFVINYYRSQGCTILDDFAPASWDKLRYICSCGTESAMSWYKFKAGHRCKNCRTTKVADIRRKYTTAEIADLFKAAGKKLLTTEPFKNSQTPLRYQCSCGCEAFITLNNFFQEKDCWNCRNAKISESKKDPNITDEDRINKRQYPEYKSWRTAVFERDDYTCQCCGERGGDLNAHHIYNYADNPEGRTDVENGVTLCERCHKEFHSSYGYRNTTATQLEEYLRNEAVAM